MFMLMAFGAGVLMALSVLATVYLLRHPSTPVVAQAPAAPILPEQPSVASVIKITPPALSQSVPPFTPAQNPSPIPPPALEKSPPPVPSATAPAVAATPAAPVSMQSPAIILPLPSAPSSSSGLDSSKPDPKILAYIE